MSTYSKQRRVVVTGLGVVSPIGVGRTEFWENLRNFRTGVGNVTAYPCTATPGGIAGEVRGFDDDTAKKEFPKAQRKNIKVMCREIYMGTAAAFIGLKDAGLDEEKLKTIDRERMGVEFGANLMFFRPDAIAPACDACLDDQGNFQITKWGVGGMGNMEPLWLLKYLPNMPGCHVAIAADARGPNNSVTVDEASPGAALTEAHNVITRGWADIMIVGATGTRLHPTRCVHARMWDILGYDPENPNASCRPFDRRRNGQVVGEGAACLILEEESHALKRGATIYAEMLSGHTTCVMDRFGKMNKRLATSNALSGALRGSGIAPSELGHINAHGSADVQGDLAEAQGIRDVLGDAKVPVTAFKGFFGNTGSGCGMLEIASSILFLKEQNVVPHILNTTQPDPACQLNLVVGEPIPAHNKTFISVNNTRVGQASAVVFRGA